MVGGDVIEALPSDYKKLIKNRPDDIGIHMAVCGQLQTMHYVDGKGSKACDTGMSGIWEITMKASANNSIRILQSLMLQPCLVYHAIIIFIDIVPARRLGVNQECLNRVSPFFSILGHLKP